MGRGGAYHTFPVEIISHRLSVETARGDCRGLVKAFPHDGHEAGCECVRGRVGGGVHIDLYSVFV